MPDDDLASAPTPSVIAVVSAFAPSSGLVDAVRSVVGQVARVIVVDDGSPSDPGVADVLRTCGELGAEVRRMTRNVGIGAALNEGLRAGLADPDLDWFLTLDQDTALPPDYVSSLVATAEVARARGRTVGSVAPERAGSVRSTVSRSSNELATAREPIQSGLLVSADVLRVHGLLDEGLFIDGVDTELWLRTTQAGAECFVAVGTGTEHRLGTPHVVRLLGRSLELTVAATFRYYYQQRNLVELVRRWGRRRPGWAIAAIGRNFRHLAIVLTIVPGRRGRWVECVRGWRDGLRGVSGRRS